MVQRFCGNYLEPHAITFGGLSNVIMGWLKTGQRSPVTEGQTIAQAKLFPFRLKRPAYRID
jgi:hypothetical protein